MRTLFTSDNVKNFIEYTFNGNLAEHRANPTIAYENKNDEPITLIDSDNGQRTLGSIAEYLNLHFYAWKERLVSQGNGSFSVFDDWVQSLNLSFNEAYALVELTDEEVTASQNIDSATKRGRITFLIQTDKINTLEYYLARIKNNLLGKPVPMQNSYGDIIKTYTVMGILSYDEEPSTTQLGECVVVSCNFSITYLNNALAFSDIKVELSLNGDTDSAYKEMIISEMTWQNLFSSSPIPTATRPDLTGACATALTGVKTITFYDFANELTTAFDALFWRASAYKVNGTLTAAQDVNIPVFVRVTSNGNVYVYKDMIDRMEKKFKNNDFTICSITFKTYGKVV